MFSYYIDDRGYHWGHRSLPCRWETLQTLSPFGPSHQDSLWKESYSIFIIALLYFIFFWSDKNDQFVLPLFRVINCVLFVYPSMVYYYIFIWIILYSFWLVCCCSNELIPECFFSLNAETVVTDVALAMFFFCCLEAKGQYCLKYYFLYVAAVFLWIVDLWHRARLIQQCIFFTDIYLLVLFLCRFVLWCLLLIFRGQTGLKR